MELHVESKDQDRASLAEETARLPGMFSAGLLAAVLDQLDHGVMVVRGDAIDYRNRAARRALAAPGSLLLAVDGRLTTRDGCDRARLDKALRDAQRLGRHGMLKLNGPCAQDGAPFGSTLALVPLVAAQGGAERAVLAILARPHLCSAIAAQWFCTVHRLTPAESVVLRELLHGHEPQDIARRKGVALATIRAQIARIKDKTDLHSIRQLVCAAANLPPRGDVGIDTP